MNSYLTELFAQLNTKIKEDDSFSIRAEEGEPAIVTVRSGAHLRIYVQDKTMTSLRLAKIIDL